MARGNIAKFTVELDMIDPEKIRKTLARQGVDMAIVNANGPGGGNPVVQLTGTATKLATICFSRGYDEITLVRGGTGHVV